MSLRPSRILFIVLGVAVFGLAVFGILVSIVTRPSKLGVLFFRASGNRLVRSDIPFWFFRLKGQAAKFVLKDSGFDMERLGITPKDIARQGPGVILDETSANGDRLLVWAE